MSEAPKIYAAISAAMADINPVGKDQYNQQQKFRYRGIDDVMNALYPVLSKHGLFIVPEVLDHRREERATKQGGNLIYSIIKIRYSMYASDGSSVSAVVIGEGMDSADKSSNKAMAVAMKYALFQMFCIPTEEMANDDPDGHSPPDSKPQGAQAAPNSTPQATQATLNSSPHGAQTNQNSPPGSKPQEKIEGSGNTDAGNATGTLPESKPKKYRPKPEVERIKAYFKTDDAGFAKMREALIAGGVIPNKAAQDMTEEDCKQMFAAIWKNFGGDQPDGQAPYYDERAMQEIP